MFVSDSRANTSDDLEEQAIEALDRAIRSFRTLSIRGGYVHLYDLDTGERWGEGPTDERTIEVQPPGTPTVGMAYLRAFRVTGRSVYLEVAKEAAEALISLVESEKILISGATEAGELQWAFRSGQITSYEVSFGDASTITEASIDFTVLNPSDIVKHPVHSAGFLFVDY